MVVDANAVVQPSAMVIKALNTDIADVAVAGARGTDDLAVGAELVRIELLQELKEIDLRVPLQGPRVLLDCHDVRHKHLATDQSGRHRIVPGGVI